MRILTLILVLLITFGGAYIWIARVPIIERFLSDHINAQVTIEKVQLGLQTLTLEGLRIANPTKSLSYALQCEAITVEMNPLHLFKQTMQIDRIEIRNLIIGIELYNISGTDNNWSRFLSIMPSDGNRKIFVKKLAVSNTRFEAIRSNGKPLSIPTLPSFELENLGENGSITPSQLGCILFRLILQKVSVQGLLQNIPDIPKHILEGLNYPKDQVKGLSQKGVETINRKIQEASGFIKELFNSGK
jgi:hypothetical protein